MSECKCSLSIRVLIFWRVLSQTLSKSLRSKMMGKKLELEDYLEEQDNADVKDN